MFKLAFVATALIAAATTNDAMTLPVDQCSPYPHIECIPTPKHCMREPLSVYFPPCCNVWPLCGPSLMEPTSPKF